MEGQADRGLSTSRRPLRDSAWVWGLLLVSWFALGGIGTTQLWVSDLPGYPSPDFGILSKFADHLGSAGAGKAVQQRLAGLPAGARILFVAPAGDWTATEVYDAIRYSAWPRKVYRVELEPRTGTPLPGPDAIHGPVAAVIAYRVALPPSTDPEVVAAPIAPQLLYLEVEP